MWVSKYWKGVHVPRVKQQQLDGSATESTDLSEAFGKGKKTSYCRTSTFWGVFVVILFIPPLAQGPETESLDAVQVY